MGVGIKEVIASSYISKSKNRGILWQYKDLFREGLIFEFEYEQLRDEAFDLRVRGRNYMIELESGKLPPRTP